VSAEPLVPEPWPYNLPLWRRSHQAASPDGRHSAVIDPAYEVSMSNPTRGTLRLSSGLAIDNCNPAFLFSADSRYLAVPRWHVVLGLFRRQHLLVVHLETHRCYRSRQGWWLLQPEHFSSSSLRLVANPTNSRPQVLDLAWPDALETHFRPVAVPRVDPQRRLPDA
jgi:hypothetical protein